MILIFFVSLLILMWMTNYIFENLIAQRTKRKGFYIFLMVLAGAIFIFLFKILKTFFVIAIPIAILLSFMLATRKR